MSRLQDFPSVTPTASDNILIVQSDGQGLASVGSTLGSKMDKANPTGTGTLSIGRKADTTIGNQSIAIGSDVEASGSACFATGLRTVASGSRSFAEGQDTQSTNSATHAEGLSTQATGSYAHAEGYGSIASAQATHAEGRETKATINQAHAEGYQTEATGNSSHAENYGTKASGAYSHAQGLFTEANHRSQHVFGEYNDPDPSTAQSTSKGTYVEIVGKGTSDARSNARTLDWSGNETLAGGLKVHGNQDAATLNLTGSIAASGGTLDCSSYADGAIIFLYRPTANKVGIYVKTNPWTRVIPIMPISTVSVSGYVITNNDSEVLRGSVIST